MPRFSGRTAVAVGRDGRAAGVLIVVDILEPNSTVAVRELKKLGPAPVLLTDDNSRRAANRCAKVGIDEVLA